MRLSRQFWILVFSFIAVLVLGLIIGHKSLDGNGIAIFITLACIAYSVYIFKMIVDEYMIIKQDKENGIVEEVFWLHKYKVIGLNPRDNMPPMQIAVFKRYRGLGYIGLVGDYSCVSMKTGKKYEVTYLKYSRTMVSIKKIN